jgi:hypothetical protein
MDLWDRQKGERQVLIHGVIVVGKRTEDLSDFLDFTVLSCMTSASFQAEAQGCRMFRLIKSDLAATGKPHLRN